MPGQPYRMFVNVVHACPNACFSCVDFKGDTFYGFDRKTLAFDTPADRFDALLR